MNCQERSEGMRQMGDIDILDESTESLECILNFRNRLFTFNYVAKNKCRS